MSRQYVEIYAKVTNTERAERCDNFDSVTTLSQTDVKSFFAGEGIRGPFVLVCGNLHTASVVCHT